MDINAKASALEQDESDGETSDQKNTLLKDNHSESDNDNDFDVAGQAAENAAWTQAEVRHFSKRYNPLVK
jgi:hypothetical protein